MSIGSGAHLLRSSVVGAILSSVNLLALGTVIYKGGQFTATVTENVKTITTEIGRLNVRVDRLNEKIVSRSADRWRKDDMDKWCYATQRINPAWICADPHDLRRRHTRREEQ